MKLAIPSETADGLASTRSGHFGHTPYFTIVEYDADMNIVSAESVKNVDHDQFGCGGVIEYVFGLGVDHLDGRHGNASADALHRKRRHRVLGSSDAQRRRCRQAVC